MGEYAFPLDEWFRGNAIAFDDLDNQARPMTLGAASEISLTFAAFLHQPRIIARNNPCDWYYAH